MAIMKCGEPLKVHFHYLSKLSAGFFVCDSSLMGVVMRLREESRDSLIASVWPYRNDLATSTQTQWAWMIYRVASKPAIRGAR